MATSIATKSALKVSTPAFSTAKPSRVAARRVLHVVKAAPLLNAEIEKPLGLKLKASKAPGGGCVVAGVSGNAAKSGIKVGDTVVYTSSFFGEELWPADAPAFAMRKGNPSSQGHMRMVKGDNNDYNVKRLPKKPAPARFGRKLTATQQERATHICVDCGYIYYDATPFEQVDPDYRCPQCKAPKKRFAKYNNQTGKQVGGTDGDLATLATVIGGLAGVGIIAFLGFSL